MEKVKAVAGGAAPTPHPPAFAAPSHATTTSPPPVPATFASPIMPTDPSAVLDHLVAQVAGVDAALLASVDGFGIAQSSSMSDEPAHPAMLAAVVGLAHQLAAMGGGDTLRQLVVEHERGLVVIWPTGGERVLAVLASTSVDQRALRRAVQERSSVLSGARR